MSEEAKEVTKKKGSKLPIIMALMLVLAGGGFFAMKGKGAPKKAEVKMGEPAVIGEFLVNLVDGDNVYLRTEVSLGLNAEFKKEEVEKQMPAIKSEIVKILRSKTLPEVRAAKQAALEKEVGTAVNKILMAEMKDEDKKKFTASKDETEKLPEGWISAKGPVVEVYFTSFTTQ